MYKQYIAQFKIPASLDLYMCKVLGTGLCFRIMVFYQKFISMYKALGT